MAEKNETQIVITAKDLASDALTKIGGVLVGALSISAVAAFGKAAVAAASEQEQAEMKLAQALGYSSEALINQASALQKTTKYADEQIISAQASLAMFTKNETQLKQLTKATLDFAAAKGLDLTSAADIVGKSLGSETSMLGRYGIATAGAADSTARFASIMQGLRSHFGGQAEAQADTFAGSIAKLTHQFDEVMESIGNVIAKNPAVIAAMNGMARAFEDLGGWLQKNQIWVMEFVKTGLVDLAYGVFLVIDTVRAFHNAWSGLKIVAQGTLIAITETASWVFATLNETILQPFDWMIQALNAMGANIQNPLNMIQSGLQSARDWQREVFSTVINDAVKADQAYDALGNRVLAFADDLEKVNIKATSLKTTPNDNSAYYDYQLQYAEQFYSLLHEMDLARQSERTAVVQAEYERRDQILADSFMKEQVWDQSAAWAAQARANITNAANKSMETQLLRLVEMHKFSAAAIGMALAQAVKVELVAMAAKAAVQALYFLGMGLAASTGPWAAATLGNPAGWFAAAGEMAAISAANLTGAVAVNAIVGSGAQQPAQGASPNNPTYVSSGVPEPSNSQQQGGVTHITLHIENPIGKDYSKEDWERIAELYIAPAINSNIGRGVNIEYA